MLAAVLLPTASALASGSGTSAGDQQYVDPLTTTTPATTHTSTTQTTTTQATTSTGTTSAPSSPASTPSSSSPATATSTATTPASTSSRTLPYTGLNIEACVGFGLGLLGAGLLLRRIVARA